MVDTYLYACTGSWTGRYNHAGAIHGLPWLCLDTISLLVQGVAVGVSMSRSHGTRLRRKGRERERRGGGGCCWCVTDRATDVR